MGNSGWTADPDDLTLPPGGAPPDPFIYIGDDDFLFPPSGSDFGIAFHFGTRYGFVLTVDQLSNNFAILGLQTVNALLGTSEVILTAQYDAVSNFHFLTFGTTIGGTELLGSDINLDLAAGGDFTVDGVSQPRGILCNQASQAATAFVAAETVVLTLPTRVYQANRAYEVTVHGGIGVSAINSYGDLRLRKTNTAGQQLTEFYRFNAPAVGIVYPAHGVANFKVGAADVTADLVLTLQTSVGTVQHYANANSAREITIKDIGDDTELSPNTVTLV